MAGNMKRWCVVKDGKVVAGESRPFGRSYDEAVEFFAGIPSEVVEHDHL